MGQLQWIVTPEEPVCKPKRKIRSGCNESLTEVPCDKCQIAGRDRIVPGQGMSGRAMFIGICPGEEEA